MRNHMELPVRLYSVHAHWQSPSCERLEDLGLDPRLATLRGNDGAPELPTSRESISGTPTRVPAATCRCCTEKWDRERQWEHQMRSRTAVARHRARKKHYTLKNRAKRRQSYAGSVLDPGSWGTKACPARGETPTVTRITKKNTLKM